MSVCVVKNGHSTWASKEQLCVRAVTVLDTVLYNTISRDKQSTVMCKSCNPKNKEHHPRARVTAPHQRKGHVIPITLGSMRVQRTSPLCASYNEDEATAEIHHINGTAALGRAQSGRIPCSPVNAVPRTTIKKTCSPD